MIAAPRREPPFFQSERGASAGATKSWSRKTKKVKINNLENHVKMKETAELFSKKAKTTKGDACRAILRSPLYEITVHKPRTPEGGPRLGGKHIF